MPNIVANDGNKFAFLTNSNAPKNKLVRVRYKEARIVDKDVNSSC